MSAQQIVCPVCGHRFDPSAASACGSCPLASGCEMVCCPNCGHTTVDVNRSGLVQLANRIVTLFRRGQDFSQQAAPGDGFIRLASVRPQGKEGAAELIQDSETLESALSDRTPAGPLRRLNEIPPGERARVVALGESLTPPRCARLQAYGVAPGYWVKVIQHEPVTVVQVEHLELAMEAEVAEGIWVVIPSPLKTSAPGRAASRP